MNNIEQRLRKLIAQTFEINEADLPSELSVETVDQWDSLGHLTAVIAVEKEFGLKFQTHRIPHLTSLELLKAEIEYGTY